MKCFKGHTLDICKSNAGYYKGTIDENGFPYCRLTAYHSTLEEVEKDNTFREGAPEVMFCNNGCGCFKKGN